MEQLDGMQYDEYFDKTWREHAERFDPTFVWNSFLAEPFAALGMRRWCVVLIQGLVETRVVGFEKGELLFDAEAAKRARKLESFGEKTRSSSSETVSEQSFFAAERNETKERRTAERRKDGSENVEGSEGRPENSHEGQYSISERERTINEAIATEQNR